VQYGGILGNVLEEFAVSFSRIKLSSESSNSDTSLKLEILTFEFKVFDVMKQQLILSIINKMQRYKIFFITVSALHVSGGFSANRQELKTVHTASGICMYVYIYTASGSSKQA
jgi:hypothetical protein